MKEKNNKIFASLAVFTITAGMLNPTVIANTYNPEKGENIETHVEYKADLQDLQINTIMGFGEDEFLDDEFGGFDDTSTSNELSLIGSIKIYKIAGDESMIQLSNMPQVELVDETGNVVAQTDIYNMEEMPELYYLTFENLQVENNKEYWVRVTIDDNGKTISKNATFNYLYEGELEFVSPGPTSSMKVNAAENVVKLSFSDKVENTGKEESQYYDEIDVGIHFEPFYISSNEKTMNEDLTNEDLLGKAYRLAYEKVDEYLEHPNEELPTCYLWRNPTIENNVITVSITFETQPAPNVGTAMVIKEYKIPVIPVETLSYAEEVTIDYPQGITEKDKEKIVLEYYNNLYNNTLLVYNTIYLFDKNNAGNVELLSKSPLNIVNDKCEFRYRFYSDNEFGSFNITWANDVTLNPVKYLKGDLDKDGIINGTDASMALDIYNKNITTTENLLIGDMDNNGIINGTDASMILDIYNKVL